MLLEGNLIFLKVNFVNCHLNLSWQTLLNLVGDTFRPTRLLVQLKEFVVINADGDSQEVTLMTHTTDMNSIQNHTPYFPAISNNNTADSQNFEIWSTVAIHEILYDNRASKNIKLFIRYSFVESKGTK
jgi:hypothetical protein